jgi:hypothetical protein
MKEVEEYLYFCPEVKDLIGKVCTVFSFPLPTTCYRNKSLSEAK